MRFNREDGVSLVEIMTAVALMSTLMAMAALMTRSAISAGKGDSAVQTLVWGLRQARERAVADRRNIQITFTNPGTIQLFRREVNGNTETGLTTRIDQTALEGGVRFMRPPSTIPDTPDGFGRNAAIDFGTATALIFTSDGMFVDQTGNPVNGTIYMGVPGDDTSIRAVTILGSTALITGYRWANGVWQN